MVESEEKARTGGSGAADGTRIRSAREELGSKKPIVTWTVHREEEGREEGPHKRVAKRILARRCET